MQKNLCKTSPVRFWGWCLQITDAYCSAFSFPSLLFSIICRKFLHVKNHPQQWAAGKSRNPWYQLKIKSGLRSKISFLLILRLSRCLLFVSRFGMCRLWNFSRFVICIFLRNEWRRQTKSLWNVNENAGVGGWFLPSAESSWNMNARRVEFMAAHLSRNYLARSIFLRIYEIW